MCFFTFSAQAQKVKNEKVDFSYLQYPSKPFPKAERNFKIETVSTNGHVEAEMKAEYEAEKAKIDAEYEEELAALRRRQVAYDSSSTGSKIASNLLLGDSRPDDSEVRRKSYPKEPIYPKVIDGSAVVHSKVKLAGLNETDDANVTVKFTFPGMEYTEGKITGDSLFTYTYKIKNPVKVTVTTVDGETLYDGFVNESDQFKTILQESNTSRGKLLLSWDKGREGAIKGQEGAILNDNLKAANALLNSYFGYMVLETDLKVFMGSTKKDIYPEHAEAFNNAIMGYNLLESEGDFAEAKEYFELAIKTWEATLTEKDVKNKKAKVNAKVTGGMHFNLTAAYLFTKDFKKVSYHATQLKILGEGKYERQLKSIDDFIKNYKARYKAFAAVAISED